MPHSALPLQRFAATPITGVVTNKTTGKPSAGDSVTLIRLAQGMQEATHTTTDAHGHYTLEVPDDGLHLVRVTHDLANYFRPAPAGTTTVDLDVYNAAAKVKGVTSEAQVMRIESDASGSALRVVENFFLKNDSNPPMTQFSKMPFDFWLPDGAVVEGAAAESPDGMPVRQAPVPLAEKNHYTFLFPIRPGETRFQITYRLPYTGKLAIEPKLTMPTDTVAIMIPKSMTFAPVAGAPYSPVDDEVNAHTLLARSVAPNQPLGFTLTGTGQLPRDNSAPTAGRSSVRTRRRAAGGQWSVCDGGYAPRWRTRESVGRSGHARSVGEVQVVDPVRSRSIVGCGCGRTAAQAVGQFHDAGAGAESLGTASTSCTVALDAFDAIIAGAEGGDVCAGDGPSAAPHLR